MEVIFMKCSDCAGTGKIENPVWRRELERKMDSEDYLGEGSAAVIVSRKYKQFVTCENCKGTGQVPDRGNED